MGSEARLRTSDRDIVVHRQQSADPNGNSIEVPHDLRSPLSEGTETFGECGKVDSAGDVEQPSGNSNA